jgi:hypothetical protein
MCPDPAVIPSLLNVSLAHNHIWLTCEDPETLVTKYQEYLHGDSEGDRRAVLDSQRPPNILEAGNL